MSDLRRLAEQAAEGVVAHDDDGCEYVARKRVKLWPEDLIDLLDRAEAGDRLRERVQAVLDDAWITLSPDAEAALREALS